MKQFPFILLFTCISIVSNAQVLFDGETLIPGMFGWANNPTVIANPVKGGINTSNHVISWQKKNDGNTWNGISIGTAEGFLVNANAKLRMKIYSPIVTNCKAQFQGGNGPIGLDDKTNIAAKQWVQLEWNLSSLSGKTYFNIEIFANHDANVNTLFYFDDVEFVNCTIISPAAYKMNINYIMVDQFGYRPNDKKIAVIADPQVGFNAEESFSPGAVYQVRNASDGTVVFEGKPVVWMDGITDQVSGDRGWWFDFTALTTEGDYYVYDVENNKKSFEFKIAPDVYKELLKAAVRMFYYQRTGIKHEAQYSGSNWVDDAAYLQDSVTHFLDDPTNASLFRDLRGGWQDAGDFNKYVTFVERPIHQLLRAYEENPLLFTDDFNIPESGNGIPDILDEVKWELDWVVRMQDIADGGVFIKMGNIDSEFDFQTTPSHDKRVRYYGPKCSSSSICAAGFFAHAAMVYNDFPEFTGFVEDLKTRAVLAYNYYQNNPKSTSCDNQKIQAGDADMSLDAQARTEVAAAIYLFALTGESVYHDLVKAKYAILNQMTGEWGNEIEKGEALLFYTTLPDADPIVKTAILNKKINDGKTRDTYLPLQHLYKANVLYSYYWGGNSTRADCGNFNLEMLTFGLDSVNHTRYLNRGLDILHYLHGVNPLSMVYLTSMKDYGADFFATEIFHLWYNHGTPLDTLPAPGYLPGGPNISYSGAETPPKYQPYDKSYRNFNGGKTGPPSWEITEPMCSYQSTYVMLVSKFIGESCNSELSVDSIILNDNQLTLKEGESKVLSALLMPYGLCNPYFHYKSDNPELATVDFMGKIEAINSGDANIIVSSISNPEIADTCKLTVLPCPRIPYQGTTAIIPGIVEVENYDEACGNVAYTDSDTGNSGKSYRLDNVDIEPCTSGGFNVGWTKPGEWLEYAVSIEKSGFYDISVYEASQTLTGKLEIVFSNGPISTGDIELPVTGGWQTWKQVITKKISLNSGEQIMRINIKTEGFNLDKISIAEFSNVSVNENKTLDFDVIVLKEELLVRFPNESNELHVLKITDIAGRKVYQESFQNDTEKAISSARFKSGIYLISVQSNSIMGIKKVAIIR